MMKYTITTAIFVALLSVLQAQIEIQPNYPPGGCFCERAAQQPLTYEWSGPEGYTCTADGDCSNWAGHELGNDDGVHACQAEGHYPNPEINN